MVKLLNLVKVNIATTGTGTVTFGSAFSNAFFTPSEAGAADGDSVSYVLVEGNDTEIGTGVIGSSVTTMTRTVLKSKIGGVAGTTKMTLGGTAWLAFTALNRDIALSGANSDITSLSGLTTALSVAQGGTADTGTAWTTSTPTPGSSGGGSFTSASATVAYKTIGKTVFCRGAISITTVGAATGAITLQLPFTLKARITFGGKEVAVNGLMFAGDVSTAGLLTLLKYDNTSNIAAGTQFPFNFAAELA